LIWKCERNKKHTNHNNAILFIFFSSIFHDGRKWSFSSSSSSSLSLFSFHSPSISLVLYKMKCVNGVFFCVYIFRLKLTCITNEKSNKSKITNFMWFFFFFRFHIFDTFTCFFTVNFDWKEEEKICNIRGLY
jgi:hypothetical protein